LVRLQAFGGQAVLRRLACKVALSERGIGREKAPAAKEQTGALTGLGCFFVAGVCAGPEAGAPNKAFHRAAPCVKRHFPRKVFVFTFS
jgi:hypothetical protein